MKLGLHSVAVALGIEDCNVTSLDAAAAAFSALTPYSGASWNTDMIHLTQCEHATMPISNFEKEAGVFGIVLSASILVWLIGQLVLPKTPPPNAEKLQKYSFPQVVEFLESIPFLGVIITLTVADLVCSVIEVLAMRVLLGTFFSETFMAWAESLGFSITLWMVIEQQITMVSQGVVVFFSDKSEAFSYVAVMLDFMVDLFAKDLEGLAGLLIFVRIFKIYKVIDSFEDSYEQIRRMDSELGHAGVKPILSPRDGYFFGLEGGTFFGKTGEDESGETGQGGGENHDEEGVVKKSFKVCC